MINSRCEIYGAKKSALQIFRWQKVTQVTAAKILISKLPITGSQRSIPSHIIMCPTTAFILSWSIFINKSWFVPLCLAQESKKKHSVTHIKTFLNGVSSLNYFSSIYSLKISRIASYFHWQKPSLLSFLWCKYMHSYKLSSSKLLYLEAK